jgi:hypothetical protein
MVAVAMDAGRPDEAAECGEEFQGREDENGAPVERGARRFVADLADGGLAVTGVVSCWLPAQRANGIDPVAQSAASGTRNAVRDARYSATTRALEVLCLTL